MSSNTALSGEGSPELRVYGYAGQSYTDTLTGDVWGKPAMTNPGTTGWEIKSRGSAGDEREFMPRDGSGQTDEQSDEFVQNVLTDRISPAQIKSGEAAGFREVFDVPSTDELDAAILVETQRATAAEEALDLAKADASTVTAALSLKASQTDLDATNSRIDELEVTGLDPDDRVGIVTAEDEDLPDPSLADAKAWIYIGIDGTLSGANAPAVAVVKGGTLRIDSAAWVYYPPSDVAAVSSRVTAIEDTDPIPKLSQFVEDEMGDASTPFPRIADDFGNVTWEVTRDGVVKAARARSRVLEYGSGATLGDVNWRTYVVEQIGDWAEITIDQNGWISRGVTHDGQVFPKIQSLPPTPTPEPEPGIYLPVGKGGLSSLPKPAFIAHRGLSRVAPSQSWEAFEAVASLPADIGIELDIRTLGDGTTVINHDASIGGVSLSAMSALSWRQRTIDVGTTSYTSARAATWDDILSRFGNRRVICAEIKSTNDAAAVVQAVRRHGISPEYILFFGFENSYLSAARSFGFPTLRLLEPGSSSPSSVVSAGHGYVGLDDSESDERIEAFIEAGLKVYIYTTNRRWIADRVIALGVHGIISDDPIYVRGGANATRTTDPFALLGDYHGMTTIGGSDVTIAYESPAWLKMTNSAGSVGGKMLGWASPSATATITMDVEFTSGTDYFQVYLGTDDRTLRGSESTGANGYALRLTKSGTLSIQQVDDGSLTELDSASTTAISNGTVVPLSISISPTGLSIERTDTEDSVSVSDATHRPLTSVQIYVYRLTAKIRNIVIS